MQRRRPLHLHYRRHLLTSTHTHTLSLLSLLLLLLLLLLSYILFFIFYLQAAMRWQTESRHDSSSRWMTTSGESSAPECWTVQRQLARPSAPRSICSHATHWRTRLDRWTDAPACSRTSTTPTQPQPPEYTHHQPRTTLTVQSYPHYEWLITLQVVNHTSHCDIVQPND